MVKHKYGYFTDEQIEKEKIKLRKSIFWLILYTDPKTKHEYEDVDVISYQLELMERISGLNSLLDGNVDLVKVLTLLELALQELMKQSKEFDFGKYRKKVFDAGAVVDSLYKGQDKTQRNVTEAGE